MAFTYTNYSIEESFNLQAPLNEFTNIYVYGANWSGSTWVSDPTAALSAVNDAFDNISDLAFSGIQILQTLTSQGTAMAFAVDSPLYKGLNYISPDDISSLRVAIQNQLNTVVNLAYGDVVLSSSKKS